MKKLGIIFLGIGCGIVLYILFLLFFKKEEFVSPIEEQPGVRVIEQNTSKPPRPR